MNRPLIPLLLTLGLLVGANCRNAPEERQAADAQEARTGAARLPSPTVPGSESEPSDGSAKPSERDSGAAPAQKPSVQQCASDGECTLSRFIPGECCQDCEERPTLRSEHEAKMRECSEALARCPMRNCAPRIGMRRVACLAGTCQLAGKNLRD